MATPLLTATPGTPPTYNPSMADTFSWVPVEGAGRPLYARATYLANPEDIKISLSADDINVNLGQLELNTDEIEGLVTSTNFKLDALTAVDYATSTKQDITNSLLDALTAKETTISLDVSAINVNTDELEQKFDLTTTLLNTITAQLLAPDSSNSTIGGYVTTINQKIESIGGYLVTQAIAAVADLDEIRANTELGTSSDVPLFVNQGTLMDTDDSVSIDKSINQTVTTALTSKVYIAGGRKVYNVFGISTAGTNQYIQFYNTTNATPSGNPIGVFYVPANSNFSFDLNRGLNFTNNVLVVNSMTPVDYTPGNNDLYMTVIHN